MHGCIKGHFFFLTSKRQYYFTETCFQEQPSYFYMNQCLVEAVTVKGKPSLQVRHGNSLTSAAKPINTRAMGQWKRNWNTRVANTDEGRCVREKAQPAFSSQKAWQKKKYRDMPGWEEEESRAKPVALRHWLEKQRCKMPGKQVVNHILKPEGKKAGQTGMEGRNKYLF